MKNWKIVIKNPFKNCALIYPIQQRKVHELIEYFKQNENVKSIIIFGSSVTSKCHIGSDVDIYVELYKDKKVVVDQFFNFVFDLWTNFTVDERLKKEILTKGVVVYEK